ncbi:MAG: hypothetical protein NTV46_00165 [Verrucomicrobia bacterium]|nr:hypothetical protein [Verrucomicrobiota bacterium]
MQTNPLRDGNLPVELSNPLEDEPLDNLRGIKLRYDLGGVEKFVYHLAINLN